MRLQKAAGFSICAICGFGLVSCQKVKFSSPALQGDSVAAAPEKLAPAPVPVPSASVSPVTPVAQPWIPEVKQAATPVPKVVPPVSVVSDPLLSLGLLRFESDSWFKVCFWLTVNGVPLEKAFLGCNKGSTLIGTLKTFELDVAPSPVAGGAAPGTTKPVCSQIGIKAAVFKNTQNCTKPEDCKDETYAKEPSYVRTTGMAAGPGRVPPMHPFIVRELGDGAPVDARILMTPELEKAEREWSQSQPVSGKRIIRVIFEDQTDESFAKAVARDTDWKSLGMDFNDVVFDLDLPAGQGLGFDLTQQQCAN